MPSLPKNEFPSLLNSLPLKIKENSSDNLKAGFRKKGIWPMNKAQIMSRLPGYAGSDIESTSELVIQSFIEHLINARGVETDADAPREKCRKVPHAAGKSLSADDIPAPVFSCVSLSRKATKVTRPTPGISAEPETDDETRSSTGASHTTSAASSG